MKPCIQVLVDGTYTRVLDEPSLSRHSVADTPGDKFRRILHRTSVRLSQKADKLPESIYVRGVKIVDRHNLNGGAFADIYKGVYNGEEVAVKKLRVTLYQSPDKRTKTIKVCSFNGAKHSTGDVVGEGSLPRGSNMATPQTPSRVAVSGYRSHVIWRDCMYAVPVDVAWEYSRLYRRERICRGRNTTTGGSDSYFML